MDNPHSSPPSSPLLREAVRFTDHTGIRTSLHSADTQQRIRLTQGRASQGRRRPARQPCSRTRTAATDSLASPRAAGQKQLKWRHATLDPLPTQSQKQLYACRAEDCDKSFFRPDHPEMHYRTHTGERPFLCWVLGCQKQFTSRRQQKNHLWVHIGEKPYGCTFEGCSMRFTQARSRNKHIKLHSRKGPYSCGFEGCCLQFSEGFTRRQHLLRTHVGEQTYRCPVENCGVQFSQEHERYRHLQLHSGKEDYTCPFEICNMRFTGIGGRCHTLIHAIQVPLVCPFQGCGIRFSREQMRNQHFLRHYAVQWPHIASAPACKKNGLSEQGVQRSAKTQGKGQPGLDAGVRRPAVLRKRLILNRTSVAGGRAGKPPGLPGADSGTCANSRPGCPTPAAHPAASHQELNQWPRLQPAAAAARRRATIGSCWRQPASAAPAVRPSGPGTPDAGSHSCYCLPG